MVAAMFWIAREVGARQGARRLVQAVAWSGLAISVVALLTRARTRPISIYGIWSSGSISQPLRPLRESQPHGHVAGDGAPAGDGLHLRAFRRPCARRGSFAAAIDTRMVWLIAAAGVMFVAVVLSLSRSAAIGTVSAGVFAAAFSRTRRSSAWRGLLATAAVFVLILVAIPRSVELGLRFESPQAPGTSTAWARSEIWRKRCRLSATSR